MMNNHRILGLHSGALGDVVLFAQLLSALRRPGQRVALAAGGEKARLLQSLGIVDEAIDLDTLGLEALFTAAPDASRLQRLSERLGPCGQLVSCFGAGDEPTQRRLTEVCQAPVAHFLPIRPAPLEQTHLLDAWSRQMGLAGVPVPLWQATAEMRSRAAARLTLLPAPAQPFIALHVGAGSRAKCWPVDSFIALADQSELPAVFLLGPAELDRFGDALVQRLAWAGTVLADPLLFLSELAGVLALATAYVGNDSGPTHLAAALGCPTLAIFGPTEPAQFAPRGQRIRWLRRQPIGDLSVEEVAAARIAFQNRI